jgi:hypothetical protein
MTVHEEIVHVLFDEAQTGWDEHDIGITADAVVKADDHDDIAHVLWSMGMSAEHDDCPYADGEGDADYSNDSETCRAHLERVAARIRAISITTESEIRS